MDSETVTLHSSSIYCLLSGELCHHPADFKEVSGIVYLVINQIMHILVITVRCVKKNLLCLDAVCQGFTMILNSPL